jgi:undecaprenyl-diphosphatase
MAFWPMVALLVGTTPRARRWLLVPAIALVLAIGSSRIYLDVHWTTDVASGFLLGLAWLLAVVAVRRSRLLLDDGRGVRADLGR